LTLLGYDTRWIDGSIGPNTRRALAMWQQNQGQRASGYLTADQVRLLLRQSRI
jgi:peptidoglycan hydrolase-like protein with peptidoglycan-binding domain